jgi:WD40 repeat protein
LSAGERAQVLIVDQCEEMVTLCHDADQRARFLDEIERHADAGGLVVALRADRLGDLAAHPGFARLVERGLFLLRTPTTENLRAAIEGPARQSGLLLEPGLVEVLLRDVEGEPGALPLLSHALRQTWERRERRTLTVEGYRATGGIRGAVAQTAERVYHEATEREQPIVRDLMLRLVTPNPDGEPVRNRIALKLGATDDERAQVIEVLVRSRLITSDEGVVELAHEWLARAWPRLRDWLDDDAEGQRIRRHLTIAAESWAAMAHSSSELYRGVRLARALEWRCRTSPDLDDVERSFLDASERAEHDHELALAEHARRQARANRRLRLIVGAAAVLGLVAVAGWVAARQEAGRADAGAARARAHELAASSTGVLAEDPTLAKLLAVASARADEPGLNSITALHRAWNSDRAVWNYEATEQVGFIWTDLHPSGERIVAAGLNPFMEPGRTVEVVETFTGDVVWSVDVGAAGAADPRFVVSPVFVDGGDHVMAGVLRDDRDGRSVEAVSSDARPVDTLGVHVWDATTGELVEHLDLGPCGAMAVAASATHVLVRTRAEDEGGCRWTESPLAAELVDRGTGERELLSHDVDALWAALSRNGRFVAYDRRDSDEIFVVDTRTGERAGPIGGCCVRDVTDDGTFVIGGMPALQVWDTGTGEAVATFDRHGVRSWFARFEADDRTVVSTGSDGALRRWDAATGEELFSYPSAGNGRPSWTTDGVVLVGQPDHNSATLLDLRERGEIATIETCSGFVMSDSLASAAGAAVVHIDCGDDPDATTHVIDLERREVVHRLRGHMAQSVAISPLGDRFVRQEGEGTTHGPLVVRAVETGEIELELAGTCRWEWPQLPQEQDGCELFPAQPFGVWPQRLRWSPDGSMIAMAFREGFAVWDADTGALLHTESTIGDGFDAAFTRDSSRVTVTAGRSIRTLSTTTWETTIERELSVDDGMALGLAGYTPDGSNLLVVEGMIGQASGSVHWFDPVTLLPVRSRKQAHDGSIRAMDLADDGTRLATASADGVVRVWDVGTGALVHEVPFPDGIRGVAFVDDVHLAVVPNDGNVMIVTTDVDELLEIVEASLSRDFRPTECSRFGFGDRCSTHAEPG